MLFVSPGCPACAEAEALLDASGAKQKKRRQVLPSPKPGFILIEPGPVEVPAAVVPATPALWDPQANVLYVGLEAVERALGAEA